MSARVVVPLVLMVLAGFIRGQLLVALIMGSLYAIAFSIIGIPLALQHLKMTRLALLPFGFEVRERD